jgi:hypothetical protein
VGTYLVVIGHEAIDLALQLLLGLDPLLAGQELLVWWVMGDAYRVGNLTASGTSYGPIIFVGEKVPFYWGSC